MAGPRPASLGSGNVYTPFNVTVVHFGSAPGTNYTHEENADKN